MGITSSIERKEWNPWESLAIAVVEQAIQDWYLAMNYLHCFPKKEADGLKLKSDVEKFFRNEFQMYSCGGISGEEVLEELNLQWERGKRAWKSTDLVLTL